MAVTSSSSGCPRRLSRQTINTIMRNPIPTFPCFLPGIPGFCPPPVPGAIAPVFCPFPTPVAPIVCPPAQAPGPINIQIINNVTGCPFPVNVTPTPVPTVPPVVAGITDLAPIPVPVVPVAGVVDTRVISAPLPGRLPLKTLNALMRTEIPTQRCPILPTKAAAAGTPLC